MMAFDASRRISASDALQHRYFRSDPLPSSVEQLPKPQQRQTTAAAAATDGAGAATGGVAAESGQQGQAAAAQDQQQQQQQPAAQGEQGSDALPSAGRTEGTADPQQAQQAAAPAGTPLFGGLPLSAVPESMLGRVERPKLDSSDIQFFKKRKFNLDDAEGV